MSLINILDAIAPESGGAPSICELGKIKIGGKSKQVRTSAGGGTWRAPEKHDYFTITTMNRDTIGDLEPDSLLMEQLATRYADSDGRIRHIPIRVLSDDIEEILQTSLCWYGGKTIGARSDGKRVTWYCDASRERFGQRLQPPIEEDWKPEFLGYLTPKNQPLFKVHSNFNCVIAAQESRWGGVYKFRTSSVISFRQLHGSLIHIARLTGGILSGLPLELVVRPMQVAPDGKPTTVHVVHVELRGGDLMQLQQQALHMSQFRVQFAGQVASANQQYRKLLAAPGNESQADAADIAEEFAPEEISQINPLPEDEPFDLLPADAAVQTPPIISKDIPVAEPVAPPVQSAPISQPPAQAPPSPEEILRGTIRQAINEGAAAVSELLFDAAKRFNPDLTKSQFLVTIGRMALAKRKLGKEHTLPMELLVNWHADFAEGRIVP